MKFQLEDRNTKLKLKGNKVIIIQQFKITSSFYQGNNKD